MFPASKGLLYCGLACLLAAGTAHAQDASATKPLPALDFSKDPCGNPLMESQVWSLIEGTVSKVVDGNTIILTLPDPPEFLRVHLVGISVEGDHAFAKKTRERLRNAVLNKSVRVIVNPDLRAPSAKLPGEVTGLVSLSEGRPSDAGLTLLTEGLARFKTPLPYTLSNYTECQYRRAETEAQSKKLGLWH